MNPGYIAGKTYWASKNLYGLSIWTLILFKNTFRSGRYFPHPARPGVHYMTTVGNQSRSPKIVRRASQTRRKGMDKLEKEEKSRFQASKAVFMPHPNAKFISKQTTLCVFPTLIPLPFAECDSKSLARDWNTHLPTNGKKGGTCQKRNANIELTQNAISKCRKCDRPACCQESPWTAKPNSNR